MHRYLRDKRRSTTVLGLISGVCICLLALGLGPPVSPLTGRLFACAALIGLGLAVALESDARKALRRQSETLASHVGNARVDPLTGLGDGRALDLELGRRIAQWKRQGVPVSLLLIDLDNLKELNKEHGHEAGDKMLWIVARTLCCAVREMDVVTRYGKQRFGVVLPGTSLTTACRVAERTRGIMADNALRFWGKVLRSTVSIGAAHIQENDDAESLVQRAHEALGTAKRVGRNQVYFCHTRACLPVLNIAEIEAPGLAEC